MTCGSRRPEDIAMDAKTAISIVMTLFALGQISAGQAIAWADEQILACDAPDPLLFDLSLGGPDRCLRLPEFEFPARPLSLSFQQAFAARAVGLSIENDADALDFADWAAARAMGEDLEHPFVQLGYLLDHMFENIPQDAEVLRELRETLPALLTECHALWPHRFEDLRITNHASGDDLAS